MYSNVMMASHHHHHHLAAAAAAAGLAVGVPLEAIGPALAAATLSPWRMEMRRTASGGWLLNDAYNANPTSVTAALDALATLPVDGRRIAVLGAMRELGEHSDEAHAAVGRRAAALGIDVLLGVGAEGRKITEAAVADATKRMAIIDGVNADLAKLEDGKMVRFLNINDVFVGQDGKIPFALMPDQLHPNAAGYQLWADAMKAKLAEMMK
mgnify:CR=1 FL=1